MTEEVSTMKRDMEFIRKLMLWVEAKTTPYADETPTFDGYSQEEVAYHSGLLIEAGLAEGINASTQHEREFFLSRLTWEGHEFLDAARNETVWKKAMATVKEKGLSLGFDVLKGLLQGILRSSLHLPG